MLAWNGYYISEYSLKVCDRAWLRMLCYSVKRCKHGAQCKTCCHMFTKPELLKYGVGISRTPTMVIPWLESVPLQYFFWEVQYGAHQIRPAHDKIFTYCTENLCVNLQHMYRGFRGTESDFWGKIRCCAHGRTCTKCCWNWTGSVHKQSLEIHGRRIGYLRYKYPGQSKPGVVFAYRVAYFLVTGKRIPRTTLGYHQCGSEGLCCNPHHVRFIPSRVMVAERGIASQHRRVLEHKLYIEAAVA
jgi:hypothetical protein